jgi:hypothetical protein
MGQIAPTYSASAVRGQAAFTKPGKGAPDSGDAFQSEWFDRAALNVRWGVVHGVGGLASPRIAGCVAIIVSVHSGHDPNLPGHQRAGAQFMQSESQSTRSLAPAATVVFERKRSIDENNS